MHIALPSESVWAKCLATTSELLGKVGIQVNT